MPLVCVKTSRRRRPGASDPVDISAGPAYDGKDCHAPIGGRETDMSDGFGNEVPHAHGNTSLRPRARYLVVIDSGGFMVARMFLESREQVAEFDASTEEVAQMIMPLRAEGDASDPQWDRALAGHSASERAAARVYVLEI